MAGRPALISAELMAEAIDEPDPGRKLDLAARWLRQQMERSSDVIRAFREGSRFDPEVAADHRRILDNRSRNMERFIDSVAPSLAPGMSAQTATDLLWAFSNEELYRELVAERGWSADDSSAGWPRSFVTSFSGSTQRPGRPDDETSSPTEARTTIPYRDLPSGSRRRTLRRVAPRGAPVNFRLSTFPR